MGRMGTMRYRTRKVDDAPDLHVLELHGELDLATVPVLDEWLAGAPHADYIVDLTDVPFADSTGVGFLIRLWNRALEGRRRVVLCGLSAGLRRTLKVVGLTGWIPIAETMGEALVRAQPQADGAV